MPRKVTVDAAMRRSYRKRDVEEFVWTCLKLTEEEIKNGINPKLRTFSGRDIVGFVNTLVHLEKVRKSTGTEEEEEDYGEWGKPDLALVEDDE